MWKGIDVSDNQGVIDWGQVAAAGVQFAILRSVRRSGKADYQFAANLAGCQQHGIPVAVYKYTYATTAAQAQEEARQVVDLLQSHGLTGTIVWWDVEDASLKALGESELTDLIGIARAEIEAAGYRFGLYIGYHVAREHWFSMDAFPTTNYWTARYYSGYDVIQFGEDPDPAGMPQIGRPLWGWQHSSTGRVPGIKGNADLDVCYQDPAADWMQPVDPGVIWCVSIADVWNLASAQAVASAYPGCKVHRAKVLDAGGLEIWVASVADVWTKAQAVEVLRQFADLGVSGFVHQIRVLE